MRRGAGIGAYVRDKAGLYLMSCRYPSALHFAFQVPFHCLHISLAFLFLHVGKSEPRVSVVFQAGPQRPRSGLRRPMHSDGLQLQVSRMLPVIASSVGPRRRVDQTTSLPFSLSLALSLFFLRRVLHHLVSSCAAAPRQHAR